MPTAHLGGIDVNYRLDGDGNETIVLLNGLADDLESWDLQMPALLDAGLRVLQFDSRGIGKTSAPRGPYTSRQLAADTKALVDHVGLTDHHVLGVSVGGMRMVAQEYALAHGDRLRSLTLACTYAAPGPFCSRLFALWGELARSHGVPFVMREVALWAFTARFFEECEPEAQAFEEALAGLDTTVQAYLVSSTSSRRTRRPFAARHRGPHAGPGRGGGRSHSRAALPASARRHTGKPLGAGSGRSRLPLEGPGPVQRSAGRVCDVALMPVSHAPAVEPRCARSCTTTTTVAAHRPETRHER